jgi:peptide deformylase
MNSIQKIQDLNKKFEKILEECPSLTFVGDRILHQKTVDATLQEGIEIAEKLKAVLTKYRKIVGYGRGLAAPQIGENKSVFITYANDQFQIYINPKITARSAESNFYREGCLSCGYIWAVVKRPVSISLEFVNEQGESKIIEADNFLARLLQHEYDHLEGIVNIDIAEPNSIEFMVSDPLEEKLCDA